VAVLIKSAGCPFCIKMGPIVEEVAGEYADRVKVYTMDVTEGMNTAIKFGVMGVPRLLIFKAGHKVGDIAGWVPKERVVAAVESALK
jgi:thioredoxin 1